MRFSHPERHAPVIAPVIPLRAEFIAPPRPIRPDPFEVESRYDVGVPICPECHAGKCGNCDGRAFDDELDAIVSCQCACQAGGDVA